MLIEFLAGAQIPLSPEQKLYVLAALNLLLRVLTTRPVTFDPAKVTP
jgi:hypothetical protein